MGNFSAINKNDCSGCGACVQICPQSCLALRPDKEGFLHPIMDSQNCVNCGKCIKVCPVENPKKYVPLASYAAISKDNTMLKKSSSGAIFPLLAQAWIQEEGYVCAAEMTKDLSVKHVVTNKINELRKMQGSKYVQSYAFDTYEEMPRLLEKVKKVLFIGTPCQVSAVRNMFKKNLDQLLLVDLICHGVPSQLFFQQHLSRTYNQSNRLQKVLFRDKPFYEASSFRFTMKYGNHVRHIQPNRDAYYNLFLKGASYRESCYTCRYACAERVGDITLGDCSTGSTYPCFPYSSTVSTVILSTKKGQLFWDKVKSDAVYCKLNFEEEIKRNHQLCEPSKRPKIRDAVYQDFQELPKDEFEKRYTYQLPLYQAIKQQFRHMIPLSVKGKIRKFQFTIRKK